MDLPMETKAGSNCTNSDFREAEYDGIEVKEVMSSSDDCQIVLIHNRIRFILVMVQPPDPTDGDIMAKWFQKIEEAEKDPDEMGDEECLEDLQESAISVSRDTMYALSSSVPVSEEEPQTLEDFLYPITFCLQIVSEQGILQTRRIDDAAEYVEMFEPVKLPGNFTLRPTSVLTPAAELEFIKDLYMGQVLKVSQNGNVCVFKSANHGSKTQLMREIQILQRISEQWEPDDPVARPAVPRLLGLVGSHDQVIGILEDFIDGDRLSELDINEISAAQRQEWKQQIEQNVTLLHQHSFIWGDVKADNILVDKHQQPWLIDFGGSCTQGWVDEHLAETIEGDLQGLRRLAEYLGVRNWRKTIMKG